MNKRFTAAIALAAAAVLGGCDSDPKAPLAVVHASPDAPEVNVKVDGTTVLSNVDYGVGSAFLDVDQGTRSLTVEGILPGTNADVIGPVNVDLVSDTKYYVLAVNNVTAIEPLIITSPDDPVDPSLVRVTVVHAAPAAPQVDVYVTDPSISSLTGETPLGSFAFKGTLGPVEVPADRYRIRVTVAGDPTQIVYDSGAVDLAGGADLLIAALQRIGAGDAPIKLLVLDGAGSTGILDRDTPANLRVVHSSADAPAVDVAVNDDFSPPLIQSLAFPDPFPSDGKSYATVDPGDYNLKVVETGTMMPVFIDADVTLAAGNSYSVLALNTASQIEPLLLEDDIRAVATEARVRLIHASPSAGPVDIYVTAQGADLNTETPAFTNVALKGDTGYVALAAGNYDITITPSGSKSAAIGPLAVSLQAGTVYTAIARDAIGGGAPLTVTLLDGFLP